MREQELRAKLHDGEFVVSTQIDPPSTASLEELYTDVRKLQDAGVSVVDVNTSRRLSHDAVALAANLKDAFGLEVIPHISPRDSSLSGLLKQILTAYTTSDVKNFLVITGDPYQTAAAIHGNPNPDAIEALRTIDANLRQSNLSLNLTLAAAVNQNERDSQREADRLRAKEHAGADFFMSQPVFTPEQADIAFRFYRQHTDKPLVMGIWPLMNTRTLQNIRSGKVVGVEVPDEIYEEGIAYGNDAMLQEWGIRKAHELATVIRENTMAQGIYIVAPLKKPGQLTQLIEKINGI